MERTSQGEKRTFVSAFPVPELALPSVASLLTLPAACSSFSHLLTGETIHLPSLILILVKTFLIF